MRSASAHYAVASGLCFTPTVHHIMGIIEQAESLICPHRMLQSASVCVGQNSVVTVPIS